MGKVTDDFNGAVLAVYDRERTICDCFRYRTKLDNEIFNKAVNAYAADKNKLSKKKKLIGILNLSYATGKTKRK